MKWTFGKDRRCCVQDGELSRAGLAVALVEGIQNSAHLWIWNFDFWIQNIVRLGLRLGLHEIVKFRSGVSE